MGRSTKLSNVREICLLSVSKNRILRESKCGSTSLYES